MDQNPNAVVLFSGGLDSTTVAALARSEGKELYALTIDYGQRHRLEIEAARKIASRLDFRQHIVLPLDLRRFGGSSLTGDTAVAKDVPAGEIGRTIPSSYVPARNTIFLSLALAFAETVSAFQIYIGVSQVDYSGYPDCREVFLQAFEKVADLATRAGVERTGRGLPAFSIESPLLGLGKADIIRLGLSLGVDYSLTHTCYDPVSDGRSCGRCESCLLRLRAFREAGLEDPLPYAVRASGLATGQI